MKKEMPHLESSSDIFKNQIKELNHDNSEINELLKRFDLLIEKKQISPLLEKAMHIAFKAHEGQEDRADAPYILHPFRLMLQMETEEERIVAILHDVVEDSEITVEELRVIGFPENIIEAVNILTRKDNNTYEEFIEKIKSQPIARRVKLADIRDNLRLNRIAHPTEDDFARIEKYKKALNILELE